jgi:hypothetical protein
MEGRIGPGKGGVAKTPRRRCDCRKRSRSSSGSASFEPCGAGGGRSFPRPAHNERGTRKEERSFLRPAQTASCHAVGALGTALSKKIGVFYSSSLKAAARRSGLSDRPKRWKLAHAFLRGYSLL